jgi:hypothetical protein
MFRVDGNNLVGALLCTDDQLTADDETFFVRQRKRGSRLKSGKGRFQPHRPRYPVEDNVGVTPSHQASCIRRAKNNTRVRKTQLVGLSMRKLSVGPRCKTNDLKAVTIAVDDLERLGPNGARRAQKNDPAWALSAHS